MSTGVTCLARLLVAESIIKFTTILIKQDWGWWKEIFINDRCCNSEEICWAFYTHLWTKIHCGPACKSIKVYFSQTSNILIIIASHESVFLKYIRFTDFMKGFNGFSLLGQTVTFYVHIKCSRFYFHILWVVVETDTFFRILLRIEISK